MSKFLDELVNEVQQLLGNKVVCEKKVIRKNNVSKDAIVIFSNGNKIGKIIYVDEKETTAAEVVELFNRKEDEKPVFDIEKNLLNWNCVKEKIKLRFTTDENYASGLIHRMYANLYVIPYVEVPFSTNSIMVEASVGSVNLPETMLSRYGVTEDEIFKAALENMESDALMVDLNKILLHFTKPENLLDCEPEQYNSVMICVTNKSKMLGATYILLDNVQKHLETIFPEGFYLCQAAFMNLLLYQSH